MPGIASFAIASWAPIDGAADYLPPPFIDVTGATWVCVPYFYDKAMAYPAPKLADATATAPGIAYPGVSTAMAEYLLAYVLVPPLVDTAHAIALPDDDNAPLLNDTHSAFALADSAAAQMLLDDTDATKQPNEAIAEKTTIIMVPAHNDIAYAWRLPNSAATNNLGSSPCDPRTP